MDDMERARTLFLVGIEQLQDEHFAAAADSFRACLALAPGRASALDNLSVCLLGLNQFTEAEAACSASRGPGSGSRGPGSGSRSAARAAGSACCACRSRRATDTHWRWAISGP